MPENNSSPTVKNNEIDRVNILGVGVSALNMDIALEVIDGWIASREQNYVCVTPVHSIVQCLGDEELRRIFSNAGMVTPDGMPVVWTCRLMGFRGVSRVYGPDLMLSVCALSDVKAYRHYFLGGAEGVVEELIERLSDRFPKLNIVGSHSPPFRELTGEEEEKLTRMINDAEPDIIWVGLGAPKQERWMAAHMGKLNAPVLIGVGAAFDMHAGRIRQAPVWMRRSGTEWIWRLILEPRRLWRRYAVSNSLFVLHLCSQLLGLKKYKPGR